MQTNTSHIVAYVFIFDLFSFSSIFHFLTIASGSVVNSYPVVAPFHQTTQISPCSLGHILLHSNSQMSDSPKLETLSWMRVLMSYLHQRFVFEVRLGEFLNFGHV